MTHLTNSFLIFVKGKKQDLITFCNLIFKKPERIVISNTTHYTIAIYYINIVLKRILEKKIIYNILEFQF